MQQELEKDVEKHFCLKVKQLGGLSWKFRSLNARGVADRVVCLPDGTTWFVELKRPGGSRTGLQRMFADEVLRLNQNYACLVGKQEVDAWFETLKELRTWKTK